MDIFAQIAANGIGGREELLHEPQPIKFDKKSVVLDRDITPLEIKKKISTKEELYRELAEMKTFYAPFLQDLTPKLEMHKEVIKLEKFLLNGEEITLPHYQGPLGNHKQVYETTFQANIAEDKAAYVCFQGADYYAVVYINGICVGTHEGFFSPFEFEITSEDCQYIADQIDILVAAAKNKKLTISSASANDYAASVSDILTDCPLTSSKFDF